MSATVLAVAAEEREATLGRDLLSLAKPGITLMNVVTAAGGFFLAPVAHPWALAVWTLLGTTLVVSGAGALNCYLEADVDKRMARTRNRPLPAGRLVPWVALAMGLCLSCIAVAGLTLLVNPLTGLLAAVALVLYVLVYTPLKQHSWLATPVGAIPGAMPPLLGWAAATGSLEAPALALFAVMYFWQLPHFHALALWRKEEYREAGLYTLPLAHGDQATRWQIVRATVALFLAALSLVLLGIAGPIYLVAAVALGVWFSYWAFTGLRRGAGTAWARGLFLASLWYLLGLFAALLVDVAL